jgi:hypothetical protein
MRTALSMAVPVLLAACTAQPLPQERVRPAVVRQHKPAPPAPASRPRTTSYDQAESDTPSEAEASKTPEVADQATPVPASVYRVTADGIVGCADPQALLILRRLRETGGASPRLLVQAHQDGRCMTVFRVSRWALESVQGQVIKLRLVDGPDQDRPISLYFLRDEVDQP